MICCECESEIIRVNFVIPSTPPTDLTTSKMMKVKYYILVSVFEWNHLGNNLIYIILMIFYLLYTDYWFGVDVSSKSKIKTTNHYWHLNQDRSFLCLFFCSMVQPL